MEVFLCYLSSIPHSQAKYPVNRKNCAVKSFLQVLEPIFKFCAFGSHISHSVFRSHCIYRTLDLIANFFSACEVHKNCCVDRYYNLQ